LNQSIVVHWFRRDLRLSDNTALTAALNSESAVLPIFIFDPNILEELPKDDARVSFIYRQLSLIKEQLLADGGELLCFHKDPLEVFKELSSRYPIRAIFTNRDYEPYALQRDSAIQTWAAQNQIEFKTFKDQVIFEHDQILKTDGKPYTVYTPYMKKWQASFSTELLDLRTTTSSNWASVTHQWMALKDLGFTPSPIEVPDYHLDKTLLDHYSDKRDFPAQNGTSQLSTHLRFGTVSIRQIVKAALESSKDQFLKELIWREFFMQVLWHFPYTITKSFKSQYDNIPWRNAPKDFDSWKTGNTGYPLVDAGMRELNATGLMHNRVRMVVASFLCKHLLIDWRLGEAYFASKLLDYEQASNVGNWQWAAGCGCDAAPYFRIFNPSTQWIKFDKASEYVSKWVPEFQELDYPRPIVDHKEARIRCLESYKRALAQF